MSTAMIALGIDRMSVAERVELALEIWESLEGEVPVSELTAEEIEELERRDLEMDTLGDSGIGWDEMRRRIEAGEY